MEKNIQLRSPDSPWTWQNQSNRITGEWQMEFIQPFQMLLLLFSQVPLYPNDRVLTTHKTSISPFFRVGLNADFIQLTFDANLPSYSLSCIQSNQSFVWKGYVPPPPPPLHNTPKSLLSPDDDLSDWYINLNFVKYSTRLTYHARVFRDFARVDGFRPSSLCPKCLAPHYTKVFH